MWGILRAPSDLRIRLACQAARDARWPSTGADLVLLPARTGRRHDWRVQLATWLPDGEKLKPPPLWFVSNGAKTVGPVTTTLLVESARRGLSRQFYVRDYRMPRWRTLAELREVRAVDESAFERKKRIEGMAGLLSCEALLRLSDGTDETLRLALRVLKERLGADVGFVHRFERGRYTPVTRHALGGDTETRIGCPILPTDVLAHVARRGRLAIGDVHTHHAFRIAASRLGGRAGEVVSVAMLPLTTRAGVVAMIELGRMDHSFRTGDARALRAVAGVATSRLS